MDQETALPLAPISLPSRLTSAQNQNQNEDAAVVNFQLTVSRQRPTHCVFK